ncbi:hypothetical protein SMC4_02535, partial [Candidatus Cryosericum hinesii]
MHRQPGQPDSRAGIRPAIRGQESRHPSRDRHEHRRSLRGNTQQQGGHSARESDCGRAGHSSG